MDKNSEIVFLGRTTFRDQRKKFGLKIDDRRRHMYAIGKTGMGKTALLKNMIIQDIRAGRGVGFLDPHGEAAEEVLQFVPSDRINDVIYFNPADVNYPLAFNVMEQVGKEQRHLVASGLMGVFKKIWPDVWSARMEYILNNAVLALLEYPGATLLAINRLLADENFRQKVIDKVSDPVVKAFWRQEFARYSERYEVEATAAVQNKIGQLISAPLIRNIVGQVKTSIDMRKAMDQGKILIVNLSKGKIGEDSSKLLGALMVTKLQLAAMARADVPESERRNFFLYVDEFQNFATGSFANILSEARKYHLSLTLSHQYIAQMDEAVQDAIMGNVGTFVVFRIGAQDAEVLEKEFSPELSIEDLVNIPKYNIYTKLMINGTASRPFSAQTLSPFSPPEESYTDKIVRVSRERYGTPRKVVEEKISRWAENIKITDQTTDLYDAVCDRCGKKIKVPFKPDPERSVYCKSCLKKVRQEEKKKGEEAINKDSLRSNIREALQHSEAKTLEPDESVEINTPKDEQENS